MVILPKQGQSVETCIITEWYKKKGDKVAAGDLLFSYETDKASFEEEAQVDGVLLDVFYGDGDEVPVLSEVAVIGEPGETVEKPIAFAAPAGAATTSAAGGPSGEVAAQTDTPPDTPAVVKNGKTRISPRARRMAGDKGISLDGITGSGPNGRIIVRDIEAIISGVPVEGFTPAAAQVTPGAATAETKTPVREEAPRKADQEMPARETEAARAAPSGAVTAASSMEDGEVRPLGHMRKLIAKAMHASLQNSAQLTHHLSADARQILSLRDKVKKMQAEGYEYNITLNDMVCYATIRALKKHPDANVHFLGDAIRYFRKVHLGMAVDTERGLMVPALRNADDLSLPGLSTQLAQLAAACRSGKVDPDILQPEAASFTISNLGAYGVEMFTPVINLPQAGILGVNTIIQRPAQLEGGAFGFVPYMGLSLTYDHRALDGGPATLFLAQIKQEIENFDHDLLKL